MKRYIYIILSFSFTGTLMAQFSSRNIINEFTGVTRVVSTADLDNDGDLDIITSSNDNIAWYENTNGMGTFSTPIPIQIGMQQSFGHSVADFDRDGLIDIVVSYFDEDVVGWYRNLGDGTFSAINTIATNLNRASGVIAKDIDGDGFIDLVLGVSNGNGLYWVQNTDGLGTFSALKVIDASYSQARSQRVGDIDGDGDMDVLSNGSSPYLVWYENTDGEGTFGSQKVIDTEGLFENSIQLVDIDGDGDIDIVSQKMDFVIWRENIDGMGTYSKKKIISIEAINIFDTSASDLDNDGDMDVLSASTNDNKIAWYENLDGAGDFGPQQIIDNSLISPRTVHPADLDGDGDMDVLSSELGADDRRLVWYENQTPLSTPESLLRQIKIYPNPAQEVIFVESVLPIDQLQLYTATGKLVITQNEAPNGIAVNALDAGLYFLKIKIDTKTVMQKVIVE